MKHYISLGAGVQSSTMALMAACGEIEPMPDGAIFADTQAEPQGVYDWLDWLEKQLPYPVHRVTSGSLRKETFTLRTTKDGRRYYRTLVPYFMKQEDGSQGRIGMRGCTRDFKIRPITKNLRRLAGVKRGTSMPTVCSWIGISLDEMQRMKPAKEPWICTRWPLIEQRITRQQCLSWMLAHGFPRPPRSACTFCPFRQNAEWEQMRNSDPAAFADAVAFDSTIRKLVTENSDNMHSVPYIHRSLTPLGNVDFRDEEEKSNEFFDSMLDECTGMCGV